MKIIKTIESYDLYRSSLKTQSLGFVATMGALHLGHISLVEQSLKNNQTTVVSIFINATQFDCINDLNNYPSALDNDLKLLKQAGVNAVFLPVYDGIYPDDYVFQIQENRLSKKLCGAYRDGHFDGVLTVVMKLLNIIKPTNAYFGEKDFQQLTLIKQMVSAFFINTVIVGCPIIREADGLAMSSRNLRLNKLQRQQAVLLYQTISSHKNIKQMRKKLTEIGFDVDYIEVMNDRLLVAAYLDEIRLIDNIEYKNMKEISA
ncbi:MAG: pantoate--beta-alanine ligase [Alcanivoracaceae bacterium]|nr:pantoate--beta-alanine ligase [Alcanivoracaceae bacterium]